MEKYYGLIIALHKMDANIRKIWYTLVSVSVDRRVMTIMKNEFGVVGMGVMGRSLAFNIERHGHTVSIYNWTDDLTKDVIDNYPDHHLHPTYDLQSFVDSLEKPRRILMMVKAGEATDNTINALVPYLEEGDVLIDGGNTFFKDTIRRSEMLQEKGIYFIGQGTSGGEEGALYGPSLMPGGPREAYELVAPILEEIAAKASEDDKPCVTYIGPDGAGHYVKMVHNGIEYGDMQLIAEAYDMMRRVLGLSNAECADVFESWNEGELDSYLIEITAAILRTPDDLTNNDLVDMILDKAGSKGTGKWTSQQALDLGEPLPVITEAVFARYMSSKKDERVAMSKVLSGPEGVEIKDKDVWIEKLRQALYFSKIMSYAQGFAQMKSASDEYHWDLQLGKIAEIFRAGCIIRARFLQNITEAYQVHPDMVNLLQDDYFQTVANRYQSSVRDIVSLTVQAGIPAPTFAAAIAYFDAYRTAELPANLIQAQRDYFGAHTYERKDREGTFHYRWLD